MLHLSSSIATFAEDLEWHSFDVEGRTRGERAFGRGAPRECQRVWKYTRQRSDPQTHAKHALERLFRRVLDDLVDDSERNRCFVHVFGRYIPSILAYRAYSGAWRAIMLAMARHPATAAEIRMLLGM